MQAQTVSNVILVAPNSNNIKLVPMAMMGALKEVNLGRIHKTAC